MPGVVFMDVTLVPDCVRVFTVNQARPPHFHIIQHLLLQPAQVVKPSTYTTVHTPQTQTYTDVHSPSMRHSPPDTSSLSQEWISRGIDQNVMRGYVSYHLHLQTPHFHSLTAEGRGKLSACPRRTEQRTRQQARRAGRAGQEQVSGHVNSVG